VGGGTNFQKRCRNEKSAQEEKKTNFWTKKKLCVVKRRLNLGRCKINSYLKGQLSRQKGNKERKRGTGGKG